MGRGGAVGRRKMINRIKIEKEDLRGEKTSKRRFSESWTRLEMVSRMKLTLT